MAKKLSVEEKRDIARHKILDVSLELFFTKGYNETTTRDIITKAGILNGSLYNRFKNKDEILISIVKEAVTSILDETKHILEKENNLLLAGAFPGSLQIYAAYRSKRMASILYEVHCRWEAVEEYVKINMDWSGDILKDFGLLSIDQDILRLKVISLVGEVGDFIGYYFHGGDLPYEDAIREHIVHLAASLNIPVINVDSLVSRMKEIIESEDLTFMGHRLSQEIPEFFRGDEPASKE